MTGTSLCVVICCYTHHRWAELCAAINAARVQTAPIDSVLVVVDHNPDLLARLTERFGDDPDVRLVASTGPQGLSGARNTAVELVAEDVLVFVDDDAELGPDALDALRDALLDEDLVAIGGAVRPIWQDGRPTWFPDEFGWVVGCDYRGMPDDGAEIRNPIGAAMAVRREPLTEIGGFNHDLGRVGTLPAGCEETLMGIALARRYPDLRLVRDTAFAVDHHVPAGRGRLSYFFSRCHHEGRSKARLTALAGASSSLSAEIRFLLRTVSTGIVRYLSQALRGESAALTRLAMMLLGVVATVAGTVAGMLSRRPAEPEQTAVRRSPIAANARFSIIIPTVGRDLLAETVAASLAQTHPDVEVIVADNRPASGRTRRVLADVDDPRLHIVDAPVPGISAARNAGIAAATGAVLAFTDDDALPDPEWAATVMRIFSDDSTGTVGVVTGRVLGTEAQNETQAWFEEAGIFDKGDRPVVWGIEPDHRLERFGAFGERGPFFPYTAGEFGSGNNMAFAAETVAAIGGFDERLGTGMPTRGGEDLDAFRSVILGGWNIVYRPDALVQHYHRDNLKELRQQSYGYGVGMAAALTKLVFGRHRTAVLRRVPAGLWVLFHPESERNQGLPDDWPRHLRVLELAGFAAGPFLFVRSSIRATRTRRQER
ncbi:MAG: glycosyltransferase [Gordonia sp. (in: high G+C Gram-positive bacteria)]|uniref:glycosyltransferase family 2 protein n=1 Tax=Gordonia sp. (in: high G+C Gram-positive bacteria) TaxID=84139 RepID=UPI0039E46A63